MAVIHAALWRLPLALTLPTRLDGPALVGWIDGTPSELIIGAVLHLVALVLTGYLVVVTTVGLVARLAGRGRAIAWADRVTPGLIRSLMTKAVPVVTATVVVIHGAGAGAATAASGPTAPPI